MQRLWKRYSARAVRWINRGLDAYFTDLNWQAFSDPEYKTIELDTRDLASAIRTLLDAGYAVTHLAESAHLIYVVPARLCPHSARRDVFGDAIASGQLPA